MFDPKVVVEKLYKKACYEVGRTAILTDDGSTDFILPSAFVKMIEAQMQRYFAEALKSVAANFASELHKTVMRSFKGFWLKSRSRETCLACLRRKPHIGLPCGHTICENCVSVFGQQSPDDPWAFDIENCFLCGLNTPNAKIRIHPPTAGAGVLCFDGGGIRGVLPLAFLKLLEDRIGLPMPVLRNFKVVFGTSSGKSTRPVQ